MLYNSKNMQVFSYSYNRHIHYNEITARCQDKNTRDG